MIIQNVSAVVTALGVVFGALSIRAAQRQRLRAFESFYVQRYWALMDSLTLDALRANSSDEWHSSDEKIVRSYIRLCEDECELRKKAWIADATWDIWTGGMRDQFSRYPFSAIWQTVKREDENQFTFLRELETEGWDKRTFTPAISLRVKAGLVGLSGV